MASLPNPYLTLEEYVARESQFDSRHEYYMGEMYPVDCASVAHAVIQSNLIRQLGNRLDGTPCRALTSCLRLHILATGLYTYPDLSIFCGSLEMGEHNAATNPRVLFEVLSPSTRRYDLFGKFEHYRQIPSLEEFVFVEQECYSIDRYTRQPNGEWKLTRYQGEDATLELSSVKITVPLQQIYANVPFELAERDPDQPY